MLGSCSEVRVSVRLTDGWCRDADAAQVSRVEDGAECESKAVDLLLNLPPSPLATSFGR